MGQFFRQGEFSTAAWYECRKICSAGGFFNFTLVVLVVFASIIQGLGGYESRANIGERGQFAQLCKVSTHSFDSAQ